MSHRLFYLSIQFLWFLEESLIELRLKKQKCYTNVDEIPKLKSLLKKIRELDFNKRQRLQLACKRFQRAYEEGDAEDQLIDLMIAFEALYTQTSRI